MRLETNCEFPAWLSKADWQIIIQATQCWPQCVKTTSPVQGGTITQERTTPQQMRFNSSSSFQLLFGGEQFSQSYSCSKLLAAGEEEVRLQLFSQSQVGTRKITLSFLLTDE